MAAQGFVISEEKPQQVLTLIVDKEGLFGKNIALQLPNGVTTVLVTEQKEPSTHELLVIPYTKTIPEIPEGNYSHIFFVWDGKQETLHVLEPLLQKAAADNAQFLFITDYHFFIPKLQAFIHQEYARASMLLTGDIFGNAQYGSIIIKFFEEAVTTKRLQLENVGLQYVYPVLYDDVVKEILYVGFGAEKGKLFLACQPHGITELSLAHIIQKVDPLIKIDFTKQDREVISLPEGKCLFDAAYNASHKIQDAYTDMLMQKRREGSGKQSGFFFSPQAIEKEKKQSQSRKRKWAVVLAVTVLLLLSPVFLTLFYAGLGGGFLYLGVSAIKTGEYQNAVAFASSSSSLFALARGSGDIAEKELHVVFLGSLSQQLAETLQSGEVVAGLLEDGATAVKNFSLVARGKSVSPEADFLTGVNAIKHALLTLQTNPMKGSFGGISLMSINSAVQPFTSILDSTPTLFGFPTKKTYAILLQNNSELRPGGGFIGSYATVVFDKGRVTDFAIHDVYDADGQLKGHVEPPYVIRRYIPQQHWYLRDSNFDVDFSQDAANAAFFLQQETGQKVDGVVGVDLTVVKDILAGIGPVYVPEYKQTVTADNFFLLTESHAEKNSFAGSTQKKDFLKSLFTAIQTKITATHGFSVKALVPLLSSLKSKDVVFGFSDSSIQDVFTVNGLSSSLWDGRKADASTLTDFTGINEANIGVNKANYFVTRKVQQDMAIDASGSASGKLTITYTNSSKSNVWPGGDYKNYVRLILPSGAKITGVTIDGKKQNIIPAVTDFHVYEAKGFVAPKGLEEDSTTENGKQLFGFITTVKAQSSQAIAVNYDLAQKVDTTQSTIAYNGLVFKQPGVGGYPYIFSLTVPNTFSLLQKPSWVQGSGNSISFIKTFGEDTPFFVTFTKQ